MITDERLKEWIEACNTERGILENTTVLQIGEALSELIEARRKIRRLIYLGQGLKHDLYAMRTHKGYEPFSSETRWDDLIKEVE